MPTAGRKPPVAKKAAAKPMIEPRPVSRVSKPVQPEPKPAPAPVRNGAANGGPAPSPSPTLVPAAAPPVAPKTVSQVLGEIAWLMMQSPRHKAMTVGDIEWFVMPAILLKQFRVFYTSEQPVGAALWALADDLVARRIDGGNTRLTAAEWKSGANMRIVDVIAPFGGEAEMRVRMEKR